MTARYHACTRSPPPRALEAGPEGRGSSSRDRPRRDDLADASKALGPTQRPSAAAQEKAASRRGGMLRAHPSERGRAVHGPGRLRKPEPGGDRTRGSRPKSCSRSVHSPRVSRLASPTRPHVFRWNISTLAAWHQLPVGSRKGFTCVCGRPLPTVARNRSHVLCSHSL